MKAWLPTLLSELQREHLKAAGFRKDGRTFSRDREAYWERFHFQGSSWNGAGVRWRFYVNAGIEFKDLPERRFWSHFAHTHWAGSVEHLVPEAPAQWEYDESTDRTAVKAHLATILIAASRVLDRRADTLRAEYVRGQRVQPGT